MNEQNWRITISKIANGYLLCNDGPHIGGMNKYIPSLDNIKADIEAYLAEMQKEAEERRKAYEAEKASWSMT